MTDQIPAVSVEKLKSCPFCNAAMEQHHKYPTEYRHAYIHGERCPAGGTTVYIDDKPAVDAWNRRAYLELIENRGGGREGRRRPIPR